MSSSRSPTKAEDDHSASITHQPLSLALSTTSLVILPAFTLTLPRFYPPPHSGSHLDIVSALPTSLMSSFLYLYLYSCCSCSSSSPCFSLCFRQSLLVPSSVFSSHQSWCGYYYSHMMCWSWSWERSATTSSVARPSEWQP
mgnify:CR=1 FL=1